MKESPWGEPQQIETFLSEPKIIRVHTASHGGLCLWPDAQQIVLARTGVAKSPWLGSEWYEEDCDCMIVEIAFHKELNTPEEKVVKWCKSIIKHQQDYFPQSFINYCQELIGRFS